jgi:hypothetical protein
MMNVNGAKYVLILIKSPIVVKWMDVNIPGVTSVQKITAVKPWKSKIK